MSLLLILISIFAGLLGSLLGIGGGIIIVPALTLIFDIDIRYAIPANLVAIIATSSGAASSFLKNQLTNIRIATILELGTVAGALTGFLISYQLKSSWLFIMFGCFLLFTALSIFFKRTEEHAKENHWWSKKLKLSGYHFNHKNERIPYHVEAVPGGMIIMYFAGIISAILGIGGGIFKVFAMDGTMKLPIKVSSATSNLMLGVTAATSAGAFFLRGDIRPEIATPVCIGILIGTRIGFKLMMKMTFQQLRKIFMAVIFLVGVQMIIKGIKL